MVAATGAVGWRKGEVIRFKLSFEENLQGRASRVCEDWLSGRREEESRTIPMSSACGKRCC